MHPRAATLGLLLASCAPAPEPEVAKPPVIAVGKQAADEPPFGDPVLVPQRLPENPSLILLDATGKLMLVHGYDGPHVVDADTGISHGALSGCADRAGFAPEGHALVTLCRSTKTMRIWDFATDAVRTAALVHVPDVLEIPWRGRRMGVLGKGGFDVVNLDRGTVTPFDVPGPRARIVVFSPGGRMAFSDDTATFVHEADGRFVQRFARPQPRAIDLDATGKILAVADGPNVTYYDVPSGAENKVIKPCGNEVAVRDVEFTDDGRTLVSCFRSARGPARVVVATADDSPPRELFGAADEQTVSIVPLGQRVGVQAPRLGVLVLDVDSGAELARFTPPSPGSAAGVVASSFERVLFRDPPTRGRAVLVDAQRGTSEVTFDSSNYPADLTRIGETFVLAHHGVRDLLDPATGAVVPAFQGTLSPDGKTFLRDQKVLVDRATDAERPIAGATSGVLWFSARGGWVAGFDRVATAAGPLELVLRLFDTATGKAGHTFPAGPLQLPFAVSPDDTRLALAVAAGRTSPGNKPCGRGDPGCFVVRTFDLKSGRRLAEIHPNVEPWGGVRFTPDGGHVVVGAVVYDASTGRVSYPLPAGTIVDLPTRGQMLVVTAAATTLVDTTNGNTVRGLPRLTNVFTTSVDGGFVVARDAEGPAVWDLATWTRKALPPEAAGSSTFVSRDGGFVFFVHKAELVIRRMSDGRTLRRTLPGLDVDITDEGVFDTGPNATNAFLVRRGPDVERSPMGASSLLPAFAHPGLARDFLAGKPVSPAR